MSTENFEPFYDWQDVTDPENPQPGAKRITSGDLIRYEKGIEKNENKIDVVLQEIPVAISEGLSNIANGYTEVAVWPDTDSDGLYWFRQGGQLVESDIPGLYEIDPNATPLPNFEIPSGIMINVNEVQGAYVRPSASTDLVVTFTGYSDPQAVAIENDRWEKLITPVPSGGRTNSTLVRRSGQWI